MLSFKKTITIFVMLSTIVVGIAGFWYYQKGSFSKEILKLEILGPENAELAEEVEYLVKYKNNGDVRLEEASLIFEYPRNSLVENKELRQEIKLDDIYPGEEKIFHFKGRLLGKEKENKTAKAWLSYRPKNLNARYEGSTTFTTLIKSTPLTFEFDIPSKIEPGKDFRLKLNYFSNVDYPLSNLRIKIDYPENFEFKNSNPKALEENEWEIGLLNKTQGGRIEVEGKLFGDIDEQKIFKAQLGIWQNEELVLLKENIRAVVLSEPSLYISQQINGSSQYIASPGEQLHYEIFFKNIGEEVLKNMFLVSTLEGKAFDLETLKTISGDFQTGDNSIVWDWKKVPKLQFLEAGEEQIVEFWINLKEDWDVFDEKNSIIRNKIYLSQVKEEFVNKVNSKLKIIQKGYFEDEVFGNSGYIPPKAGGATTYTIIWQVQNHHNDVKNIKVKATLPKNTSLTGNIFPEDQASKFAFDSFSREIVWDVGDLEAGLDKIPNIAFQISFIPSSDQVGKTPNVIGEVKVIGEDDWTEKKLEIIDSAISTLLPDDVTITGQQGIVQ
ncbi:MAG TPA: hypothetical protein ENH06_00360 [bacterium]|nr:hypothetical protein [bacterium]